MILPPDEVVRRARSLVGVPFRPQGRDPRKGLDCVGLVLSVFRMPAASVRRDYRLRGAHAIELNAELSKIFARLSPASKAAGDVLLCAVSREQAHLAIECGASIIHADARLRRVVERPGECPWPVVAAFRSTIQSS